MQKFDSKYRSQRFSALVGQPVPARYLSNLAQAGKGRHILLEGPTGCGKTSAARIYGRALNCLELQPGGEPCNTCEHCQLQLEGRFPDYREQDAGVSGGKEAITDLLDSARTPPLYGRFRVLVIDEAQAMTAAAFETLKGIAEEPPPFLVILLTTTNAKRIIADIRDRTTRLVFRKVGHADAVGHLQHICAAEGLDYEPGSLDLIAFLAQGHLRPLVGRLEQLSDFGAIRVEDAQLMFDLGYVKHLPRLFCALLDSDLPTTLATLGEWDDEPNRVLDLCREFLLWLQCRAVGGGDLTINPVFASFPPTTIRTITQKLTERAKAHGLTLDDAYTALGKALGMAPVANPLLLQLLVRDLHNLLHRQGFDLSRLGAPVHDARAAPAAGDQAAPTRRRQFSPNYRIENGVASPTTPPPASLQPIRAPAPEAAPPPAPAPSPAPQRVPAFATPAMVAQPPSAVVSIVSPPPAPPPAPPPPIEPELNERLPADAVTGAFPFKVPDLPKRRIHPHELALQHGFKDTSRPTAIFHGVPSDDG